MEQILENISEVIKFFWKIIPILLEFIDIEEKILKRLFIIAIAIVGIGFKIIKKYFKNS